MCVNARKVLLRSAERMRLMKIVIIALAKVVREHIQMASYIHVQRSAVILIRYSVCSVNTGRHFQYLQMLIRI